MFDDKIQTNNQNQKPAMSASPVASPENINQRIERLHEQGKLRKNKKVIILAIVLFILIAGGASAGFMYWDKISGLLGIDGNSCDYDNPNKRYEYKDLDTCTRADMGCQENEKPFSDDCGCGCEVVEDERVACPEDAKQCPDGSSVGRVAPNCEFAECPALVNDCVKEGDAISTSFPTDIQCCEGLKKIDVGTMDVNYCTNCGDGICKDPENKLGCMEDCDGEKKISDLESVDDYWNLYTNYNLGFSIKIPKQDKTEGKFKTVEEGDIVYIATDGSYKYLKIEEKLLSSGSDFEKVKYTALAIIVKEVRSSDELDDFIKSRYGSGCSVDQQEASYDQSGVFDISMKGDGKDLLETECPLNYATVVKYYPAKNIIASWDLGQAINYLLPNGEAADPLISESFKFINTDLKFLTDTDSDGLYDDDEEKYGTDINNSDSDGDGYLDGSEVKSGYNPMGEGKLENS